MPPGSCHPSNIVGSVLFGIATFREKILPGGGALLLVIGAPLWLVGPAFFGGLLDGGEDWLLVVPAMAPVALFGGGWAWLGYALWSERSMPA